jgi:hypothetical protein
MAQKPKGVADAMIEARVTTTDTEIMQATRNLHDQIGHTLFRG